MANSTLPGYCWLKLFKCDRWAFCVTTLTPYPSLFQIKTLPVEYRLTSVSFIYYTQITGLIGHISYSPLDETSTKYNIEEFWSDVVIHFLLGDDRVELYDALGWRPDNEEEIARSELASDIRGDRNRLTEKQVNQITKLGPKGGRHRSGINPMLTNQGSREIEDMLNNGYCYLRLLPSEIRNLYEVIGPYPSVAEVERIYQLEGVNFKQKVSATVRNIDGKSILHIVTDVDVPNSPLGQRTLGQWLNKYRRLLNGVGGIGGYPCVRVGTHKTIDKQRMCQYCNGTAGTSMQAKISDNYQPIMLAQITDSFNVMAIDRLDSDVKWVAYDKDLVIADIGIDGWNSLYGYPGDQYPQENSAVTNVNRPGLCYLALFEEADRYKAFKKLGFYPKLKEVLALKSTPNNKSNVGVSPRLLQEAYLINTGVYKNVGKENLLIWHIIVHPPINRPIIHIPLIDRQPEWMMDVTVGALPDRLCGDYTQHSYFSLWRYIRMTSFGNYFYLFYQSFLIQFLLLGVSFSFFPFLFTLLVSFMCVLTLLRNSGIYKEKFFIFCYDMLGCFGSIQSRSIDFLDWYIISFFRFYYRWYLLRSYTWVITKSYRTLYIIYYRFYLFWYNVMFDLLTFDEALKLSKGSISQGDDWKTGTRVNAIDYLINIWSPIFETCIRFQQLCLVASVQRIVKNHWSFLTVLKFYGLVCLAQLFVIHYEWITLKMKEIIDKFCSFVIQVERITQLYIRPFFFTYQVVIYDHGAAAPTMGHEWMWTKQFKDMIHMSVMYASVYLIILGIFRFVLFPVYNCSFVTGSFLYVYVIGSLIDNFFDILIHLPLSLIVFISIYLASQDEIYLSISMPCTLPWTHRDYIIDDMEAQIDLIDPFIALRREEEGYGAVLPIDGCRYLSHITQYWFVEFLQSWLHYFVLNIVYFLLLGGALVYHLVMFVFNYVIDCLYVIIYPVSDDEVFDIDLDDFPPVISDESSECSIDTESDDDDDNTSPIKIQFNGVVSNDIEYDIEVRECRMITRKMNEDNDHFLLEDTFLRDFVLEYNLDYIDPTQISLPKVTKAEVKYFQKEQQYSQEFLEIPSEQRSTVLQFNMWLRKAKNVVINGCDLYELINDLSVKLGVKSLVFSLLRNFNRGVKHFLRQLVSMLDDFEVWLKTSEGVKNLDRILDIFILIFSYFNPYYRYRPKPVWAPLINGYDKFVFRNELRYHLSEDPSLKIDTWDSTLSTYLRYLNYNRHDPRMPKLSVRSFQKAVNTNPYTDTHLRHIQRDILQDYPDIEGVDGITYATAEILDGATNRYYQDSFVDGLDLATGGKIASLLFNTFPGSYANLRLTPVEKICKDRVLKYSAGLPFYGQISSTGKPYKTKRDIKRDGWFDTIGDVVRQILETGEYPMQMYHVFPKSQVVKKSKLDANPYKLRTIIAQDIISYTLNMIFTYDVNKRQQWWDNPSKIGMPLTEYAFNIIYGKIDHRKRFFSMDFTAFDANIPANVIKTCALLRCKGYEQHPDFEAISKHMQMIYESLQHAYFVNVMATKEDSFYVREKKRGGATGFSDTSMFNSDCLKILAIDIWATVTGKPVEDFFLYNDLVNFGDDNIFATDDDIDPYQMIRVAKEKYGMDLKLEKQGSIFDQEFLSKIALPITADIKKEYINAGVTPSKYAIIHNKETLLLRYQALKSEKAYRLQQSLPVRSLYMLERILGSINLTAHQPDLYKFMSDEYDHYFNNLTKNMKNSRSLMNKYKKPSYEQVLLAWIKPSIQKASKDILASQLSYSGLSYYNHKVENVCHQIRLFINALPVSEFALDDPEMISCAPMYETYNMDVESYIYLSAVCRNYRLSGLIDDISLPALESLIGASPFKCCTHPQLFYKDKRLSLLQGSIRDIEERLVFYKKRVHLLAVIYYISGNVLNTFKRIPIMQMFVNLFNLYSFDLPKLYSFTNFLYWLEHGTSSMFITQYIPKDLYINNKYFAVWFLDHVPSCLTHFMYTTVFMSSISRVAELMTMFLNNNIKNVNKEMGATLNKIDNPWSPYMKEIITRINNEPNKTLVVSAETSTGKTFFFPQLLPGTVIHNRLIEKVIILAPRKILVEQLGIPGLCRLNRTVQINNQHQIFAATYGHLEAITSGQIDIPLNTAIIMDEFHEQSPEMVLLYNRLKTQYPIFFTSATPKFTVIGGGFSKYDVPLKRKHTLYKVNMAGRNAVTAFLALQAYDKRARLLDPHAPQYGERVLIIEPKLTECQKYLQTFKSMNLNDFTLLYADQRTVPDKGHIIATSIVDAGITIDGVTAVIDSGFSVVNHKNQLFNVYETSATLDQRLGRTARKCDGLAIQLQAPRDFDYIQYPSGLQMLERFVELSPFYKLQINLDALPYHPNNVYPYVRLADLEQKERNSALLWLDCMLQQPNQPEQLYHLIVNNICNDRTEFLFNKHNSNYFLPMQSTGEKTIFDLLRDKPYKVAVQGKVIDINTIYCANGILDYRPINAIIVRNSVPKDLLRPRDFVPDLNIDLDQEFSSPYGVTF